MATPTKPLHLGHRRRLQQRLDSVGPDAFLDHEFLELLLTYAIPRKDTKPIAWALLKRFGSVAGVLDANPSALQTVDGVGSHTARFLKLVRSAFKRYTRSHVPKQIKLGSPQEVLDYCHASLAGKQEEFIEAIFLSARNTIITTRIVASGSLSAVSIEPRQLVARAMQENAAALIVVHNHPSGDPTPSPEDITWTKQLEDALLLFSIRLLDHLIVSKSTYFSFGQNELLKEPRRFQSATL